MRPSWAHVFDQLSNQSHGYAITLFLNQGYSDILVTQ
jgi:hypothetical protein